jgi:hypothetical protein
MLMLILGGLRRLIGGEGIEQNASDVHRFGLCHGRAYLDCDVLLGGVLSMC